MQFSLRMSTFWASLVILLSLQATHSLSLSISRSKSQFHTLPLKRVEQRSDVHPQILLQRRINRGIQRLAKMSGVEQPSADSLRKRLEDRALSIDVPTAIHRRDNRIDEPGEVQLEKRFNRFGVPNYRPKRQEESVTAANPPSAPNSLGLDIEGSDIAYLATVQIGTPPQNFLILMDSGSADFWVGSESCTTQGSNSGCGNHNFLGPQSSSSFAETQNTFDTQYGTGEVSGNVVTDDVQIAGLSLPNHTFGVANVETDDFSSNQVPFDGLMGLAQSSLSTQKTSTPIESLASAGLVPAAIVSYKLSRLADNKNDGEITFGALDDSKFDSTTLVTLPNVNSQGFWEASLDSVSVNGADLGLNGRTTILDTGTTLMIVPPADAAAIHQNIPGAQSDGQGGFIVPCNTNASVALTYSGQLFTIDPRDLAAQSLDSQSTNCASGIASGDVSNNQNEWLVGDTFLKNAYFSTDVSANTISLAKLV
jgi:hypothetical protein